MKTTIHPEDILNSLGEALIITDATGVITWLNPVAENLAGVSAESLTGERPEAILNTSNLPDIGSFSDLADMALQKGKVFFQGDQVQLITRDNSKLHVSGSAVPVINSRGVTTGVAISFQDTTQTYNDGENLLASEARFSKLFNSNPVPLGITRSSDFRIVAVNDVWCTLTGYSREEAIGHTSAELGLALPETLQQIRDRLEGQVAVKEFEIPLYTRKGEEKQVLITSESIEFGGETFILNNLLDITERRQAEQKILESEQRFRSLYENATIGMYRTTPDGQILMANPALVHMLGYQSFDEFSGRLLESEGYEPGYPRSSFKSLIEKDGEVKGFEAAWTRKDGTSVFVRESAKAIKDEQGKVLYYEGTVEDITERKHAEGQLRSSEQTLRLFVEYAPAAIAMFDRNMNYLAASRRYLNDYRIDDQNIIGRSHYEVFPEITDRWKEIHRQCLAGATERSDEDQFPRADGSVDWVKWEILPWYENPDKIGGLLLISEVITDRKLAERKLRESEARFHSIFEDSPVAIAIARFSDKRIINVNNAFVNFYGFSQAELVGDANFELGLWENIKDRQLFIELLEKQGSVSGMETTALLRSGRKCKVLLWGEMVRLDNEPCIVVQIIDITDRKNAEEALYLAERRYRALIENAPDGVVLIDAEGNFKYASPSVERIFGYTRDDIPGASAQQLTHPDDLPFVLAELAKLLQDESYKPTIEYRFLHKNGSWRWIESTFSNLLMVASVEGIIINFRDIHERKLAEAELIKSRVLLMEAQRIGQIGHIEWTAGDEVLHGSDELYRILEMEIQGQPITQALISSLLSAEDQQRYRLLDQQLLANRSDLDYEFRITLPSGKQKWLHRQGRASYSDSGQPIHMISTIQDITERKKIQLAIQESEEKFRKAFETSPDSININRLQDGLYVSVNQGFMQMTGYTEEEVIGKTSVEIQIWGDPNDRIRLAELLRRDGFVENMEATFRMKNGDIRHGLMSASIIMLNNVPHILNITRDITERKHAQMALLESEEKYRTLTESFESVIVTVDSGGVFHYANQAAADAYDMTPEMLTGKSMFDLFPPDAADRQVKNIREVISSRKGKVNESVNVVKGEQRWHRTSIQPLVDASGNVNLALVNSVDITDRKRVQLEIQQKNEDLQFINTLNEAANRGESIGNIARIFASQLLGIFNSFSSAIYLVSEDDQFLELLDNSMPEKIRHQIERVIGRNIPELRIPFHKVSSYRELFEGKQGILFSDQKQIRQWISATAEAPSLTPALRVMLRKFIPVIVKVLNIHSAIVIPLMYGGKVIGTLEMYSHSRLQASDLSRISSLSTQVTAAIVRKQAEERLRESLKREQFLGDLIRDASVAVGIGYPDGRLGMCNLAMQKLTGYTEKELKEVAWNTVLTPPEWSKREQKILSELSHTKQFVTYEKEYIHKDGHKIPVELVVHPFIDADGSITHYYAFITDITERKKAEEDLKRSEAKYRLFFERVKNGYSLNEIMTDDEGKPVDYRIVEGNIEFEKIFDTGRNELVNKKGSEFKTSTRKEWAERLKICGDAALHGTEGNFEIFRNNTDRYYNVHVYSPARNYFAAIYEDITERKNIEGVLKQVEDKYFALFNSKTDITLLTEISDRGIPGRIIEANNQAVEITGYSREELLRLTPSDISIYPISGSEEVAKQLLVGNTARIEHTIRCRVGRDFPAEIVLYKIISGDKAYAIIAVHDITEVKRAEKEAEESRRLVNALMNNVPLGVTIVDADINVIWRSQAGETILGVSEKDSISKSVQMNPMYHPETKILIPYDEVPVVKAVRNDTLVENFEVVIYNGSGAPVHLSCNAVSVKDSSGDIIGGIMTYQDITAIKKREEEISALNKLLVRRTEELEVSNKELEAFSYSVSHDLRAPLRHISGFSRLLSDRLGDKLDAEGTNYLHRVNDAANLMSTLINDILKLSRVTRSELTITKVNLSDVVKTVSYDKRLAFPERKINIIVRDNLYADCDVSLMRICLNNLFENAWKFTMKNEAPEIEFGKVTRKGHSWFFIRDNGVGFDMKYADKLFGAFQRLHSTSEFEGTGIGLAIVQRVINKHGGSIWAESEINHGTTFYFTLTGLSNGEEKINTAG